jgi:DNA-binding LacI/PurR family transcriptional regulator
VVCDPEGLAIPTREKAPARPSRLSAVPVVKRSVPLAEIASSLGLSASTVSRALRRPDLVRDETRAAIVTAAEKAGYAPSHLANAAPRRGSVGLVVPDLENPFFTVLAKAVMNEVRRHETSLIVADTNEEPLGEGEIIAATLRHADGLIIASSRLAEAEIAELRDGSPLVLINRELPGIPSVLIDHRSGMNQAVEHLAALGHRTIAYVEGPSVSWSNRQRLETFVMATDERSMDRVILGPYSPRFEGGVQAADVAVARAVTAIIAYNDLMAFGIMSRLQSRGIMVPEAMSVIGFDDVPAASIWAPSLTTVTASTASIGKTAAQYLMRLLDGKRAQATFVRRVSSHLVVRSSTGMRG